MSVLQGLGRRLLGLFGLVIVAASPTASAQSITVTLVADSETEFPGGYAMPTFYNPRVDGDRIAFYAVSQSMRGVYAWESGLLARVVTQEDVRPGTSHPLIYPGPQSSSGNGRTLVDASSQGDFVGLYERVGGSLFSWIDNSVEFPGVVSNLSDFSELGALHDDHLFVIANGAADQAVFRLDGSTPTLICDTSMLVPGSEPYEFHSLSRLDSSNEEASFLGVHRPFGTGYLQGAYAYLDGEVTCVVDPGGTAAVGTPGRLLREATDAVLDNGVVRFVAATGPFWGDPTELTEFFGGVYRCLISPNRYIPETDPQGWVIESLASDGPNVFFHAHAFINGDIRNDAVYLYRGGTVSRLLGATDTIGDITVQGIYGLDHSAAEGGRLAVVVYSNPGNSVHLIDTRDFIPCADVGGDRLVGLDDLASLLANFGLSSPATLLGDLSGDGQVGLNDLAMLLAQFGAQCE